MNILIAIVIGLLIFAIIWLNPRQQLKALKDDQKDRDQLLKNDLLQYMNQQNQYLEQRLSSMQSSHYQSNQQMSTLLKEDFDRLNQMTERRLLEIDERVNHRLTEGFTKTNEAFASMVERLAKIDEAQKHLTHLSQDIVSLQSILNDKKTRGLFGEIQLSGLLESVFGKRGRLYELQCTLPGSVIVDALLKAPEPLGYVGIDSKFPLESYQKMIDKTQDESFRQVAFKQFQVDVKKHIDAISSKYIIPGVTSNQAMMFIPAEAIFAELNAYHQNLIEYAYKKHVWIVSPTTLMATLTTIQVIVQNMEQAKYAKEIQMHLKKLSLEFDRYRLRWDKLSNQVSTVYKSTQEIHTTTDKIQRSFENIANVSIELEQKEGDQSE